MTTTPPPQIWPTLRARDPRALIAFLVEVCGFTEAVTYAGDDGAVAHAELAGPAGGGVMLGQAPAVPATDDPWPLPPGSFGAYVVVPDPAGVDAIAARAAAHPGAEVTSEPHDTDYGSHDVALRDPEGNRWSFGTYPGHPV